MKKLIAIVIACMAAACACAQDRIVVDYTDTDLTTAAGANALYRRIASSAQEVSPLEKVLGLHGYSLWQKCVRSTIERAVQDVDNPLVTARHHGETPGRLYSSRATTK